LSLHAPPLQRPMRHSLLSQVLAVPQLCGAWWIAALGLCLRRLVLLACRAIEHDRTQCMRFRNRCRCGCLCFSTLSIPRRRFSCSPLVRSLPLHSADRSSNTTIHAHRTQQNPPHTHLQRLAIDCGAVDHRSSVLPGPTYIESLWGAGRQRGCQH
jgi:hypothetical protein